MIFADMRLLHCNPKVKSHAFLSLFVAHAKLWSFADGFLQLIQKCMRYRYKYSLRKPGIVGWTSGTTRAPLQS